MPIKLVQVCEASRALGSPGFIGTWQVPCVPAVPRGKSDWQVAASGLSSLAVCSR